MPFIFFNKFETFDHVSSWVVVVSNMDCDMQQTNIGAKINHVFQFFVKYQRINWLRFYMKLTHVNITRKCVLIHFGFPRFLSEFGHFYLVKLFTP